MSSPFGRSGVATGRLTLRDVFTIPDVARPDDYVLRLTSSVEPDQLASTLDSYVVTDDLAHAFDQALGVVEEAQRTGNNKAAFLEGSFGSGKSHFMAVLHALLGHDARARAIPALQPVLARHSALESANLLRLTFHFLDSVSVESTLFAQFLDQIRELHPDTLPPVLHSAQGLFEDAGKLRRTMGDEDFFRGLNSIAPGADSPWGRLGVTSAATTWTAERYDRATWPTADLADRRQVQQALVNSHFTSFTRNTDWLSLDEGLEVIAEHARSLGYDGVVLLLDELMLWLTFIISERDRLNREVQKITKLVEGGRGRLAVPITSFIARQRDLRHWLGSGAGTGANQAALDQSLSHQSGRFATIALGDENLPAIAHQRLLLPSSDDATAALQRAFDRLDRSPAVWDVLRDGVNATEEHRGADTASFRLTYPFSPALIDTLTNLAGLMQRERTALKVMQKMLVDNADRLTIDNVIPVGEAFDDIVTGTTTSSDPQVTLRFRLARDLWGTKLRPRILEQYHLAPDTPDHDLPPGAAAEARLAKTLILAAIAPNVPALKQITPARLAALNHGSIREVLPGDAATQALHKVRSWQATVPEVRTSDEGRNPVITVTLAEVDYEGVVARARGEDTEGRRRDLVRDMLFESLGVAGINAALGGVRTRQITWRGTPREVDVIFGNVRDVSYLPDDAFRTRGDAIKIVLDYPFDDSGHTAAQDHVRIERMRDNGWDEFTIVWLPGFFNEEQNRLLGQLVVLNTVLGGEKWASYAADLPEMDRPQARAILEAQRNGIRGQIGSFLQQVYGVAPGYQFPEGEEPIRSLAPGFTVRRPVGASLGEAADRLIAAAFAARYPHHPDFTPADRVIPDREINQTLGVLRAADGNSDGRFALDRADRDVVRRIVHPLELAKVNETHLVFTGTEFSTWDNRISQVLSRRGTDPREPVDVETLRHAVDPPDAGRGLSPAIRDLVVAAWASRHRRAWYLHGAPVNQPGSVRELRPEMQLRTEPLPDSGTWAAALERYALLFGGAGNPHLTANNLATFVRDAYARIESTLPDQQRLVEQLDTLGGVLELDDEPQRRTLAGAINQLLHQLSRLSDNRVEFIARLAQNPLPGTDVEAGRSIATAGSVAAAIAGTNWQRFAIVRNAAGQQDGRGLGAQTILEDLRAAASDQEHNKPLVPAIAAADDARQRWLEHWQAPPPAQPAQPATTARSDPVVPPGARAGTVAVTVTGDGDRAGIEAAIRQALTAFPHLDLDVRVAAHEAASRGDNRPR